MGRGFVWTDQKQRAFELLLDHGHTQADVARLLGTTPRTVEGWTRRPAWRTRREALLSARTKAWDEDWLARQRAKIAAWRAELAAMPTTKYRRRR